MKRTILSLLCLLFLPLLLAPRESIAAQAYTTDSQDVPLRSGGATKYRVIAKIPPGTNVEVVKPSDWTQIRYTGPDGEVKEGWVPSKSLGVHPPEFVMTRELQAENRSLKEQLLVAQKEKEELARKEKDVSEKLTKLEAAHEALKAGSANYIGLKEEYDSVKTALTGAQENIQTLIQENDSLKLTQKIKFFAAGAGVLLLGLMVGWSVGKRNKKRRPSYY